MSLKKKSISIFVSLLIIFVLILSTISFTSGAGASTENNNTDLNQSSEPDETTTRASRADKPVGNGPHNTAWVYHDIPRPGDSDVPSRIYFPTSGSGQVDPSAAPYNGIVFAPGAGGYETAYASLLSQIASWGFIVAIVGTGGPCNQEVVDIQSHVLDYYENLTSNASSVFYNKINASACGGSGHSNGGWTAIAGAVADDRFQAVCPLAAAAGPGYGSGQADTRNLHVPLQLISGNDDTTYLPSSDAYYALANPIKSYMKIIGSGHGGPFHLEYLVSFFKFWLNEQMEYGTFIYGDELEKDINNNVLLFESNVGLYPDPYISGTYVMEDENITFTPDADVVTPNPPDRVIVKYQWDFDFDGTYDWESANKDSTKYSYEDNGEYTVRFKITDSWGMTDTEDYVIIVENMAPLANAGSDINADEDELVFFNAGNSSDTASDIGGLYYRWDFGDGNMTDWANQKTNTHSYYALGKYTVKLYVKDDDDAIASDSMLVNVQNVAPVANATANKTTLRIDEPVTFNAESSYDTPTDALTLEYKWDLGDQSSSVGKTVTHSYDDEGKFTVKLTVEDDNSAESTDSITITVLNSVPSCKAMDDIEVYEDEIIMFSGTGSDSTADLDDLKFSWNFDVPGTPDSPWDSWPDYEFSYTEAGDYYAVLTVRDDNGATGTDTVKITVHNVMPIAKFTVSADEALEDEELTFNAGRTTDSESDMKSLNYTWNLDDGSSYKYGRTISYSYPDAKKYTVKLTVEDDDGVTDTYSLDIIITNQVPTAMIYTSSYEVETGTVVTFRAVTIEDTDSDLDRLQFSWDFGDGTPVVTGKVVNHTFSEVDWFMVELTVMDEADKSASQVFINVSGGDSDEVLTPKGAGDEAETNFIMIVLALVIVGIIVVLLVLFLMLKKKKPKVPVQTYEQPTYDQAAGTEQVPYGEPVMPGYEQFPLQQQVQGPEYGVGTGAGVAPIDQSMAAQQLPMSAQVVSDQDYLMYPQNQPEPYPPVAPVPGGPPVTTDIETVPVTVDQPPLLPEGSQQAAPQPVPTARAPEAGKTPPTEPKSN